MEALRIPQSRSPITLDTMFNPSAKEQAKAEAAEKRRAAAVVKGWASALIPVELQAGLQLDVKEVVCGDPVRVS